MKRRYNTTIYAYNFYLFEICMIFKSIAKQNEQGIQEGDIGIFKELIDNIKPKYPISTNLRVEEDVESYSVSIWEGNKLIMDIKEVVIHELAFIS